MESEMINVIKIVLGKVRFKGIIIIINGNSKKVIDLILCTSVSFSFQEIFVVTVYNHMLG